MYNKLRKLRVSFGMDNSSTLSDQHFGDSNFFLIYDIYENGKSEFIESRENSSREMDENAHGDFFKFKNVISMLSDVDILVAYRMGPNFINIKNNSNKIPFLTRTKDFHESLNIVIKNFEKLWEEQIKKSH